jgi:hypothetical protein
VVKNAKAMAGVFIERGFDVVSGGTENHLFLLSLIKQDISGKDADAALGKAFITVNKNSVPNDPRSPFVTSGLRFGTPAVTTRGFKEAECKELAGWICDILADLSNEAVIDAVREKVKAICARSCRCTALDQQSLKPHDEKPGSEMAGLFCVCPQTVNADGCDLLILFRQFSRGKTPGAPITTVGLPAKASSMTPTIF